MTGTRAKQSEGDSGPTIGVLGDRWALVPNPAGASGRGSPACHDRSPFLTIACTCGYGMHLHETQLEEIPAGVELELRCHRCRKPLVIPADFVRSAIAEAWAPA